MKPGDFRHQLLASVALVCLALPAASTAEGPPCRDRGVAGIRLDDVASSKAILGPLLDGVSDIEFPSWGLDVANARRTERLRALMHPGGVEDSFDEFRVTAGGAEKLEILPVKQFVSSCGVHLGMSEKELLSVLGRPSGIGSKAGRRTLVYREGPESEMVKAAHRAGYDAAYTFQEGRLAHFELGWEAP